MTDYLRTGPLDGPILLLAHGAGAGMDSPFMAAIAQGLAEAGIGVARFEFPYMVAARETGRKRPPDRLPRLLDSFREAIATLGAPERLIIGGKSMGGRVASHIATEMDVAGLVCLGFPFHPPGKPDALRSAHLADIRCPGLILQGERDPFGNRSEVEQYSLPAGLELCWFGDGNHDLKPRQSSELDHPSQLRVAVLRIREFIQAL